MTDASKWEDMIASSLPLPYISKLKFEYVQENEHNDIFQIISKRFLAKTTSLVYSI
jgi:hypothetical protein